ncbi:hypothetical protein [Neptunitalea lumnitzerae]|uniref:Uncharacterized protein n=1 Tax=Neptunitalea lumnitzerae TaxID=2965509 RepID=A0ABQ5MLC6_9FLAO|nr:hypothetical protein [Neptunitalea sp. Y10]GLB50213.1 hypothetical protein Y10_25810 [Neptunitalea sp. Y10]
MILKHLTTLFTFLLITSIGFSQTTKDELLKGAAQHACDCFTSKDIDFENITDKNIEVELGICILSYYKDHKEAIESEYGNILKDTAAMENFAVDVGIEMAGFCPEALIAITGDEAFEEEETYETYALKGTILNINTDQFVYIEVKDENGKRFKIYWLDYFEGDSIILDLLDQKKVDKKSYYIEYTFVELFDPSTKEYRNFKVLTNVSE